MNAEFVKAENFVILADVTYSPLKPVCCLDEKSSR